MVEKQLIASAKAGDKTAFDQLIGLYQGKLHSMIKRYESDPNEAADLSQEVLLKTYRSLSCFRGDSGFYTWMCRIAINTAKTHLQHKKRFFARCISIDEIEKYNVNSTLVQDKASPESYLMGEQIENCLLKTVDALPDFLRKAIILREIDGLSYDRIAKIMDCPVGTIRSRLFRARAVIDQQLQPLLSD